jgi:Tol biopolymer transport system component
VDLTTGTVSSLGAAAATSNVRMKFSGDGRFLAYLSLSNSVSQLYLYNEQAGSSALLSRDYNAAAPGDGPSDSPAVSVDGRFVAYRSAADNLAPGDANGAPDIFLYDQLSGSTTLVSASRFGPRAGSGRSVAPVFSGDGQTLFFTSWSSDLTLGDYNEASDVFALALSAGGLGGVTNTPPPLQFTGVQTESTNGPITPDEPLTLTWTADTGSGYQVQFKNSLDDPQWQPLGNPATVVGGQGSAVDSAPDPQHRFYRIVSF